MNEEKKFSRTRKTFLLMFSDMDMGLILSRI